MRAASGLSRVGSVYLKLTITKGGRYAVGVAIVRQRRAAIILQMEDALCSRPAIVHGLSLCFHCISGPALPFKEEIWDRWAIGKCGKNDVPVKVATHTLEYLTWPGSVVYVGLGRRKFLVELRYMIERNVACTKVVFVRQTSDSWDGALYNICL